MQNGALKKRLSPQNNGVEFRGQWTTRRTSNQANKKKRKKWNDLQLQAKPNWLQHIRLKRSSATQETRYEEFRLFG